MTLPRFTSGSIGKLDFSHLNDAFGYIDLARSVSTPMPDSKSAPSGAIFAKILNRDIQNNRSVHSWTEVVQTGPGTYVEPQHPRTSKVDGNDFFYPVETIDGDELATNSVHAVFPHRRADGSFFYLQLGVQQEVGMLAIGTVAQTLIPNQMWTYHARLARFRIDAYPTPTWEVYGDPTTAVNGCESAPDIHPIYGVGSSIPGANSGQEGTPNISRRPIRSGVIAVAIRATAIWTFSIPNGYSVICNG